MIEVPKELSPAHYDEELVDLAIQLSIIKHQSQVGDLGDIVDPPTDGELLDYLNKRYRWAIIKGGTGKRIIFHNNSLMPLHKTFQEATQIYYTDLSPEDHWVYRFILEEEEPIAQDTATRLPNWVANHHTKIGV